jgi:1-acyl-sn-glycerol-3-phosphate acyltransferase
MLRTTLIYFFVCVYILLTAPVGLLWAYLTGDKEILFTFAHFCMRAAGWMCRIRVLVQGKDRIQPDQPYFFLSNHQGNFDGPALFYSTGRNLRAVIKQEMMRIPLFSIVLRAASFVPVDRTDPVKARAGIDRAAELLTEGFSFFAFPEGTRSRTGQLGQFKKGVFVMAIKAGVPVVPVTIRNSRAILPPGRYAIKPGTIEVIFHSPIPTHEMTADDRERLLHLTQTAIASGLANGPGIQSRNSEVNSQKPE